MDIAIPHLVGGFNPSEKYEFVSCMIIPNIWKVIKAMFQTTSHYIEVLGLFNYHV